jgi:outer membrane protein OmpA-like peptidoglycan-associated protein
MRSLLRVAALAGIVGCGSASAIELHRIPESRAQYSAEEVVKAFAAKDTDLGATRSLCIGTESECRPAATPKPQAPSFDLLIAFEYRSDQLTDLARDNLTEFARALQDPSLAGRRFKLEGYTDAGGNPKYNLDLSKRRAEAVKRYLTEQGVSAQSLAAIGLGPAKPRVSDPFDPANRRVEARLSE